MGLGPATVANSTHRDRTGSAAQVNQSRVLVAVKGWTIRFATVALILAMLFALGIAYCGSASAVLQLLSGHLVAIEPVVVDVGAIASSEVPHHRVTVRNVSVKPVSIVGIESSCSCVRVIGPLPITLAPRAVNEIEFAVVGAKVKPGGKIESRITLLLDSASAPTVVLFKGHVKADTTGARD